MNSRKGPSLYIRLKSKNLKLIFKGIKMLVEEHSSSSSNNTFHSMRNRGLVSSKKPHRYNKYKGVLILFSCCYTMLYIKHNFLKFEYEKLKQPNFLIPRFVYRIRKQHYIYWEKSRLARGLPTTFSYYKYDVESVRIYY
jgi:hypothetical protein